MFSRAVNEAVARTGEDLRRERDFVTAVADELLAEVRELHHPDERAYLRAVTNPLAGLDREQLELVAYNLAGRLVRAIGTKYGIGK